jgi:hypothetical protein
MSELPSDILGKIEADFGADAETAAAALRSYAAGGERKEPARVLRCILRMAGGDLRRLAEAVDLARIDYRDVIFGAEYDPETEERIWDGNRPFPPGEGS